MGKYDEFDLDIRSDSGGNAKSGPIDFSLDWCTIITQLMGCDTSDCTRSTACKTEVRTCTRCASSYRGVQRC